MRKGFTLAEILVTLAVIGVVSALTIPTFTDSYNKKVWAKSLAPAISDFETAMSTMMMQEGAEDLYGTKIWEDLDGEEFYCPNETMAKNFIKTLSKYMKIKEFYKNARIFYEVDSGKRIKHIDGTEEDTGENSYDEPVVFTTSKKVAYHFFIFGGSKRRTKMPEQKEDCSLEREALKRGINLQDEVATVLIDVNGKRNPNTYGKDIFKFVLGQDGILYPYGGKDYTFYYHNDDSYHWTKKCDNMNFEDGLHCTARVIEKGFVIDY